MHHGPRLGSEGFGYHCFNRLGRQVRGNRHRQRVPVVCLDRNASHKWGASRQPQRIHEHEKYDRRRHRRQTVRRVGHSANLPHDRHAEREHGDAEDETASSHSSASMPRACKRPPPRSRPLTAFNKFDNIAIGVFHHGNRCPRSDLHFFPGKFDILRL